MLLPLLSVPSYPYKQACYNGCNAINKDGIHFCFEEYAFISDESCDYEFYIMECDCWIIQEIESGNIHVWYPDKETGIMINNQTGDIVKPKKASHLHIVK